MGLFFRKNYKKEWKQKLAFSFPKIYYYYSLNKVKKRLKKDEKYKNVKQKALLNNNNLSCVVDRIDKAYALINDGIYEYYDAISNDNVYCVKRNWRDNDLNNPIFVCVVKDDLQRVRIQINHYRSLGFNKLIYIDNISTDGTYEYLLSQGDVNVYRVDAHFNAIRKDAWIRKITDEYGYNRWYLICDSDEHFVYPNCENLSINEYIDYIENNNKSSVAAIMLDMYTDREIYTEVELNDNSILDEYCWFDIYYVKKKNIFSSLSVTGGPRKRIMEQNEELGDFEMVKYPLVYARLDDLYGYHWIHSIHNDIDNEIHAVLKHYKFLPKDVYKYKKIVNEGNYANGSSEYKRYLRLIEKGELSFFDENSKKYINSKSIMKINIFDNRLYDNGYIMEKRDV